MVLLSGVAAVNREALRKELRWLGFGSFSANLMAHPSPDMAAVEARLDTIAASEQLLIMESRVKADRNDYLRALISRSWQLDELQSRYMHFLDRFRPVCQAAGRSRRIDPECAFQVRTLLVHEYRKILLRDPLLPAALLPPEWAGVAAYQLCSKLYARIAGATERFLTEEMETKDGPLPPAEPKYFQRFGGLAEKPG
jgi:phenylacetic acid degradation operon negative regulatory protein